MQLYPFMTTALEGMRGHRDAPAALYPRKDPGLFVQEAGWAPGPVWTGAENLAPTGIRSLDRPARSQSLYRLRYPSHMSGSTCMEMAEMGDTATLDNQDVLLAAVDWINLTQSKNQ